MEQQGMRKTCTYKLKPTPEQEQALGFVVRRCRDLYNAALEERKTAWERCHVTVTDYQQKVQLPAIKEVRPEDRDAGWAAFRTILEGKAVYAGRRVVAVPPAFTSQDCSGVLPDGSPCPERVEKSLSVRTHVCPR